MDRFRSKLGVFSLVFAAALLWLRPAFAVAMVDLHGIMEVCSASKRAGEERSAPHAQGHHDCASCCLGAAGSPPMPSSISVVLPFAAGKTAAPDFSHPFLDARVLAPASRGPPTAS